MSTDSLAGTDDSGVAGVLDQSQAHELACDLVGEIGRIGMRAKSLARAIDLDRAGAVSSDTDLAFDVVDAVANARIRAAQLRSVVGEPRLAEARSALLLQGLQYTAESARELERQLSYTHPRRSLAAGSIAESCDRAGAVVHRLVVLRNQPAGSAAAVSGQKRVSPSAQWLVGSAARLLPATDRPRYGEEWRGELWDLAGEPRHRQLAHALRVLLQAWPTRRAILCTPGEDGDRW
ncbi:hypothetical protein [Streptomyces humi]|uniref:hypothetical protein n=1 Tax=Streptomyces humi TaxID=1428620 RepID=UPI0006287FA3|nr:hypothetical protein [Streptomyces humi]